MLPCGNLSTEDCDFGECAPFGCMFVENVVALKYDTGKEEADA